MKQRELLLEPDFKLKVADECLEPRVWVRRLVIWADPTKIIRDIEFRRGLNIVWSPDSASTTTSRKRRRRGGGHGAGKTLLCRLLRYCLGEETLANRELETEVRVALREGLVGAELVIDGTFWGVVRPLGIGRKTRVAIDTAPEDLLDAAGTGIEPLISAIRGVVIGDGVQDVIAGSQDSRDWLFALAWLSRDQEARYNHLLEWRNTASDSESPATNQLKSTLDDIARLLVGALKADEVACKARLDDLAQQGARVERENAFYSRTVGELELETLAAAGIEGFEGTAAMMIPTAAKTVRDRVEALENEIDADTTEALAPNRAALESLLAEQVRLEAEAERLHALVGVQTANLSQLRGEVTALSAKELEAQLGTTYCPICNVPIDRALAEGCGLAARLPDPDHIANEAQVARNTQHACEQALRDYERQLAGNRRKHRDLQSRIEAQRSQIAQIESAAYEARRKARSLLRAALRTLDAIERVERMTVRRDETKRRLEGLTTEEKQLKETLEAHRLANASTMRRWNALFRHICGEIYGEDIACQLSLTGNGLQAKMPTGGLAMEALKVVAFDLATMLMSIEGRTKMPALLIHDSPREADLGESLFHGIFTVAADLENIGKKKLAPFQYIITTTSAPPVELEDRVVLRLSSAKPEDRLLRRAL